VDWKPGGKYPVIVEYTGNKLPLGKRDLAGGVAW